MIVGQQPVEVAVVQVMCALCEELVDVSIIARVEERNLLVDPAFDNMWAHRFIHEERGELERLVIDP